MICPRCGATLPDTAELCWSCRKLFKQNEESLKSDPLQSYKLAVSQEQPQPNNNIQPNPPMQNVSNNQQADDNYVYVPFNNIKRQSYMFKSGLFGLAGLAFIILSLFVFEPMKKDLLRIASGGISTRPIGTIIFWGIIILHALILASSIPGENYVKGDAYGKLILCIIGFIFAAHRITVFSDSLTYEHYTANLYGRELTEFEYAFQIYKLLIYSGYLLILISGLMLASSAYTKDEKDMMKHNKKVG